MTTRSRVLQHQQIEQALRRQGLEGEAAFHLLAVRYLNELDEGRRNAAVRLLKRTRSRFAKAMRDDELRRLLDELVAADPAGERLADWYQHFVGRRFREGSGKFFTPRPVADAMVRLLPRKADAVI